VESPSSSRSESNVSEDEEDTNQPLLRQKIQHEAEKANLSRLILNKESISTDLKKQAEACGIRSPAPRKESRRLAVNMLTQA